MLNKTQQFLFITCLTFSLSGCTTLAKLQMQKENLANGNTVYINSVVPEPSWNCLQIANASPQWNWGWLSLQATLHPFTYNNIPYLVLKQKAIDFANQHNLSPNYIYLSIPSGISVGSLNLDSMESASASYYNCERINPDNKIAYGTGIGVG